MNCDDCIHYYSPNCSWCTEGGALGDTCLFKQKDNNMIDYTIVWFNGSAVQVLVAIGENNLIDRLNEVETEHHDTIKMYKGKACFSNWIQREDWPVEFKKEMSWKVVHETNGIYNMAFPGKYRILRFTSESLTNLLVKLNMFRVKSANDIALWRDFKNLYNVEITTNDDFFPFKLVEDEGKWVKK
jgi:hypothetical protein